jgi:hypothetical protein
VARDEDQETGVANLRQMLLTYYESVQEGEIPAMCHFAELEGSKR